MSEPERLTTQESYEAFDQPAVLRSFVHEIDAHNSDVTLLIDGIHCAACSLAIERGLSGMPGVNDIQVNPSTRHANLSWDPAQVGLGRLMQTIAELGYTPHPLQQTTRTALNVGEYRSSLKRLIVAGLGMMQVMTYAVALYAGAFDGMPTVYQQFFRLLSLLVATPIVLYSAAPFFRAALTDLRHRRVGMDVPVALAIGIAYVASVGITFFGDLRTEVYFDSVVMFTFFLSFGRFFEMLARHRTMAASEALSESMPATATKLSREGLWQDLPPTLTLPPEGEGHWEEEVVSLDQIHIGDRLLVRPGETIPADGEIVWGESATDESLLTGESEANTRRVGDNVVGGSLNLSGPIHFNVTHTGPDTVLSGIARLLERAQGERPHMAQLADHVAGYFVAGVLLIAAAVCLAWLAIEPARALTVTLSVLVVTCPCALSLATPAALTAATGFLARNGLLVTRGSALETLAKADALLLDKTGTLTRGRLKVVAIRLLDTKLSTDTVHGIAAALETGSAHPVAVALAEKRTELVADSIEVFPGRGIEGLINNSRYRIGRPEFVAELSGREADTTPQPAVTTVFLADENSTIAAFDLEDAMRPEASQAIADLRTAGLTPAILSGDAPAPVERIANSLGIVDFHSSLLPEDKLNQLQARRSDGSVIAMVGDGINDAPVLAGADVSIAMGSGSALAQASADLILLGGGLDRLVVGVRQARKTIRVIRQNLTWAIVYNVVALPLAAAGLIAPWMAAIGMSASSLIVVLNALRLLSDGRSAATGMAGTPLKQAV